MKIVFLTQYFPPEVGAPQNRIYELAIRLQQKGMMVEILTAMPNYPQMVIHTAYKGNFFKEENMDGLTVFRSWIFVSKSKSIILRLLNYFSFVFTSFFTGLFKIKNADYIFCESPPLFLGITAYFLKKIKNAKLIFNVSDLWPESAEKLGLVTNKTVLRVTTGLEEFLYKNADIITGQTQGIVKNISGRFPKKKVYWLPNGVDLSFYNSNYVKTHWRTENGFSENDFIFLYAGILGHAQGLEVILKAASRLKAKTDIKFVMLGSGPEKLKLEQLKKHLELENVFFIETVDKYKMPPVIGACSATIIPLKRLDIFKGAIPSKIFESLAMKKPILLGVEGEAKDLFIDDGKTGLAFIPENEADLVNKILELHENPLLLKALGENGLNYVSEKFTRDKIASDFFNLIKN